MSGSLKRGKMAEVPKAEPVWRRHSEQWQMYRASGWARGVLNVTDPHWQRAFHCDGFVVV